jgi:CBS-domain-containing membrane protein
MTFAFTAASTRHLPVHLVHAAQSPEDVDPGVVAARWRQRYPDVTVTTAAGHTSIAETMNVQCRPGDLLVLGRHHFRLTHQDVGAKTRSILASLPCAVAVIGDAATLDMVTVADVMTDDVVSVTADTPLKTLAELIVTHRVSGLPVVDQSGKVVGVVSEFDLLAKVAAGPLSAESMRRLPRRLRQKARGETASDVMTSDVVTVEADMTVPQAALTALRAGVRRLPVTDPAGRLVGIVTRSDLLRLLLCSDAELQSSILEDVQSVAALADLADADIEVKDGIVTVRGEAGRRTDLLKVSEDLRAVPGVVAVHNEMTYRSDDTIPPPLSGVYL